VLFFVTKRKNPKSPPKYLIQSEKQSVFRQQISGKPYAAGDSRRTHQLISSISGSFEAK